MDPAKSAFLAESMSTGHGGIAEQIVDDDPPHVWRTAQRLLGAGLPPEQVWDQLELAYSSARIDGEFGDLYTADLDRLPLPTLEHAARTLVEVVRDRTTVPADEAAQLTATRLGLPFDDPLTETLLDRAEEGELDQPDGPLVMLAPDLLLHVPSMLEGVALTHRLTEDERESDRLRTIDLPGFPRMGLRFGDTELQVIVEPDGRATWYGPPGWLTHYRAGALLAVGVVSGRVMLLGLDHEPPLDDELVAAIRAAYQDEVAEPGLPVSGEDLLLGVRARNREAFTRPTRPLSELAAAAGLEERGGDYAHEESVWRSAEMLGRYHRIFEQLGPGPGTRAASRLFGFLGDEPPDQAETREILSALADPPVLDAVIDELIGVAEARPDELDELVTSLLRAASRPAERAVARLLAAVACEPRGAVLEAESHLREAVRADPGWPPAEDRLAWYEADRGAAAAAAARWRRLGVTPDESPDLAMAERHLVAAGPEPGRNAPCWCGSGRKYKACHRGRPAAPPLPDRVGWLCRKAIAFLERRGGTLPEILTYAAMLAADPDDPESLLAALSDPIVNDVVLHEGGWFERFLQERGALLPDDEAMLAQTWVLVDRTVFEVLATSPGQGMSVRDLRTGDHIEVRERTFSRQVRAGELVCARVVPDGETHQIVGEPFRVSPGTEGELLDLLDEGDGYELLGYLEEVNRPPSLVTTDGEPMLDCRARLVVPDPQAARAELDRRYEPDETGWADLIGDSVGLVGDSRTVRAWLSLDGDALEVRTLSAARLDAVLTELREALPAARLVSDDRRPMSLDTPPGPVSEPVDEGTREAMVQLAEQFERQWCDEQVPALGGRTPREAADDPTRRDELIRLIDSFPEIDPGSGMFGLRPVRLRELLGLSSGADRP